jgi:type VI secretion system protein VasJ
MNSLYNTLGSTPIPGERPAGNDVRDEPDFHRLQAEIDKHGNPAAGATTDWGEVQRAATVLLAERGKDLLVACYLGAALTREAGPAGLADGLKVLDDLLASYWETLFPPPSRMRGRRNALQWLLERSQDFISEYTDREALQERELIDTLFARITSIETLLGEKDPEAPSMRPLSSLIRSLPVREPPPEPVAVSDAQSNATEQGGVPAREGGGGGGMSLASLGNAPISSAEDAERAFEQLAERLVMLAGWLRDADLADPQAYRLNRMAAWGGIEAAPRAAHGQTLIPAPIAEVAGALERLQSAQADEDAVQFAEAQLPAFPFWLDLNRACALALARLGERFAGALAELCGATALLLRRVPELPQLTFADGRPFADGATLEWLATLSDGATPGDAGGGAGAAALGIALGEARALASEGKLEAAAATLQRASNAAATPEYRLRARIHVCELMLTHRPNSPLRPFADVLLDDLDRHALDSWAPALALDALGAAHAVMRQAELPDEAARLLQRIARIDSAAAVRLATAG